MCMFRCWREIHHTRSARMQNTDCQSPEVPSASSYRWTVDADPDTAMPAMLLRLSLLHRKHKWVPAWMDFLPKLLTKCVKQQFCVSGCKQNLKGEMLFSIFFFFFSVGLMATQISAHLGWKSSWSTSTRIWTALGYLWWFIAEWHKPKIVICKLLEEGVNQQPQPN